MKLVEAQDTLANPDAEGRLPDPFDGWFRIETTQDLEAFAAGLAILGPYEFAGYEYRESTVVLNRNSAALNPFSGRIIDAANAYLRSKKGHDNGYNVGILFKPVSTWRFGASYRSENLPPSARSQPRPQSEAGRAPATKRWAQLPR